MFDVLKHRTENPSDNCKFTSPNVIFFLPQCVTFSKSVDMHVFDMTIHKKKPTKPVRVILYDIFIFANL